MKVTKFAGRGADHPPPSKCRGHERVGLYLCSPSGPHWPVIGRTFTYKGGRSGVRILEGHKELSLLPNFYTVSGTRPASNFMVFGVLSWG